MTQKYGYWKTSDGLTFPKKYNALIHATQNNLDLKYSYHDSVWNSFDRNLLGKVPLTQLYKERAQILRDSYQHLILYYSGGADSHNVLMTFINNNIKLDEIIVRWPKPLTEGKLYKANTTDRSARNLWSEWDYAVTPTLEWLKVNHPDIKITIKDYTEELTQQNLESVIEHSNHTRAGMLLAFSKVDTTYSKKGIGHIFGVDKPSLAVNGLNVYMVFNDLATSMLYSDKPGDIDPENVECFYWSADFPILAFEMAYQVSEYYNVNKDKRKFLFPCKGNDVEHNSFKFNFMLSLTTQFQSNTVKSVCYSDTWDNRFQADKSVSATKEDKWFWFFESPEFCLLKGVYLGAIGSIATQIDDRFLTRSLSSAKTIKTTGTDLFYIRKLDE
jgi:hypothetical protein